MTAPLPLPIAPFAMMTGDPASAGKLRPGEGDGLAGEAFAGLAFGPLLQQMLLMPAGQSLPGQAAYDGHQPNLFSFASTTEAASGGSPLVGGERKTAFDRPAATGNGRVPSDAAAMRLVATLSGLARATIGGDGLVSSSPAVQLAGPVAADLTRVADGAPISASRSGAMDGQPSPAAAAPFLSTQPNADDAASMIGGPGLKGAEQIAAILSDFPPERLNAAQTQATSAARESSQSALLHAAAQEKEQAAGNPVNRMGFQESPAPTVDPASREAGNTPRLVADGPNAQQPVATVAVAERLIEASDQPPLPQADQVRAARPTGGMPALSLPPGQTAIVNLMQPAEAGLKLVLSTEERAPAKLPGTKPSAGRKMSAAGVTTPSPLPRPEPTGATGPQPEAHFRSMERSMEGSAGLTGRAVTAPIAPSPAGISRSPTASLHNLDAGGERIQTETAAQAGQFSSSPSPPAAARHPLTLVQALPQPTQGSGLAHAPFSLGDGLTPSFENPPALPSLPALHASVDAPARSFAGPHQTVPGQLQPQAAAQLGLAIQYRIGRQETKFTLRLDPPELGRVEVSLKLHEGGRVDALIRTEHGHTLDLLQRDVRLLERAFHQLGLKPEGGIQFAAGQQGQGHTGSPFSQPQQDGMGQPHAGGGGQGEGGHEQPASEMTPHTAGLEDREMITADEGSRERPLMAAAMGLDVKV